jgi:two-component system, OmpR family, response regulator MprA
VPQVLAALTGPTGSGHVGPGPGGTEGRTPPSAGPDRPDDGTGAQLRPPSWADGSVRRYRDLALDPRTRLVRRGARGVELSRREFDLLELLVDHARMVLTREVIYDRVWGYGFGTTSNTLNVHVRSLRRKLESGGEPRLIQTVHGVGYVLRDGSPE